MKEKASFAELWRSLEVALQSLLLLEAYLVKMEVLFRIQNSRNVK